MKTLLTSLVLTLLLVGCSLTYNSADISKRSNEKRENKSNCVKLKEAGVPILQENDLIVTYLDIVSVVSVNDFNYKKGRIKIKLDIAFCGNPPLIPNYAHHCPSLVVTGEPELIKDDTGKKIIMKNIEVDEFNCFINCDELVLPLKEICKRGTDWQTTVVNTIVQIFSNNITICRFSGLNAYLIDGIEVTNDGLKLKWSLF
jgi:hypothetical protein